MSVVLVIGLPGSGKSTWARAQVEHHRGNGEPAELVDDPVSLPLVEAAVKRALKQASLLYIVDPRLCAPAVLAAAHQVLQALGVPRVREVYFANDPAQCLRNAEVRGMTAQPVFHAIRRWSQEYLPPATALPVARASGTQALRD